MTRVLLAPLLLCLTVWVSSGQTASTVETVALRRGVNMGNMLETPEEGRWGLVVKEKYFDLIKEAGFDFVRLPVAWGSHANEDPPYLIDPNFFKRIDDVVGWALRRNLPIIIDLHSYNQEIAQEGNKYNTAQKKDPVAFYNAMARFLSIWRQVSEHYKDCPPDVLFELLNEPKDPLQASLWNQYLAQAVKMIRENNPTRDVIIGPVELYSFNWVYELELPPDPHLIVTFHYYLPVDFTSQGLEELFPGSTVWLGTTWPATEDQKAEIIHNFDYVAQWSKRHGNIRILLGELGTIYRAPEDSRIRWTTFVRKQAEARGFSWSYWDFAAQFGVYDPDAETWRRDLLKALIP
jgi:endoglucanase